MLLNKFLKSVPISGLMTFTEINISLMVSINEFHRQPIVLGPILEIPSTYKNFCELKFSNILSQSRFAVDFI